MRQQTSDSSLSSTKGPRRASSLSGGKATPKPRTDPHGRINRGGRGSKGLSFTGKTKSDPEGTVRRKHSWKWAGRGVGLVLGPRTLFLGQGLIRPLLSHLQPRPSPCNDDEEVKPVPSVSQVTLFPEDTQGHHLHHHLHGEEGKDEVVKGLVWG